MTPLNKIILISDCHFEFMKDGGASFLNSEWPQHDICIIAGDLADSENLPDAIDKCCSTFSQVVYVTGNHEYYNSSIDDVNDSLSKISFSNFHWLNNEFKEINGQRFAGGTMWFPDTQSTFKSYMNDFFQIRNFEPRVYDEHDKFKNLIRQVKESDIVVSHHLPSEDSVASQFKGNALNDFFMTDFSYLIQLKQPRLWCHGHTHISCDYKIDNTRVICNPFGYTRHEENKEFKYGLSLN